MQTATPAPIMPQFESSEARDASVIPALVFRSGFASKHPR